MTFSSKPVSDKPKKRVEKKSENYCFVVVSDRNNSVNKNDSSKLYTRPVINKGNTSI